MIQVLAPLAQAVSTKDGFGLDDMFAILFATLFLVLFIVLLGKLMPFRKNFDNFLRAAFIVIGASGVISLTPPGNSFGRFLRGLIYVFVDKFDTSQSSRTLVIVAFAVFGFLIVYWKVKVATLVFAVVFTLPLFSSGNFLELIQWYVDNVGARIYEGLKDAGNYIVTFAKQS